MTTTAKHQAIVSALESVDWSFPRSSTPTISVHSLHWFPGNFIPQIPSFLIQILSTPGDIVLDPFCGSGTTGVEAIRLGRVAWQSDVNRASVWVTRGKLAAMGNKGVDAEIETITRALFFDFVPDSIYQELEEGKHPELAQWFHSDTLTGLRYLWTQIELVQTHDARDVLHMVFTDTMFACASPGVAKTRSGNRRRHHWGWVADNVYPTRLIPHNALQLFRERLQRTKTVLQTIESRPDTKTFVRREDIRTLSLPDSSVDLIVTSPPYVGMIDYTLANRLTYLWMGWSLEEDVRLEIGARRYRHRTASLTQYLDAMKTACDQLCRVLKPGRYCVIVIGASRKLPESVRKVVDLFTQRFDLVWGPKARTPSRRRVSERQGTIPQEYICVFRK